VSAMERRLRWSRRLSAAVLLLTIVIALGAVADRRRGQAERPG
jgi:hypothetical protein